MKSILSKRRLLYRRLKWINWRLQGMKFSGLQESDASSYPNQVYELSVPIVKPPGQEEVFANKLHNMELALRSLHGLVLAPNQIFSFWSRVGSPSLERGYKPGPSFQHKNVVWTVGGGLCQLSGLIYNMALFSGCEILERFPHSIDAYGAGRYLPLGRDSTVAYVSKDLAFRNTHKQNLHFDFEFTPSFVKGTVRSESPLSEKIRVEISTPEILEPAVEIEQTSDLKRGEEQIVEGLQGKKVTVKRETYDLQDQLLRSEFLYDDFYQPKAKIKRIGISDV